MATTLGNDRPSAQASTPAAKYESFAEEQIARAKGRVRFQDVTAAVLGFVILASVYALAVVLLDRAWRLPEAVRTLGWLGFVGCSAAYLWWTLWRPLTAEVNPYFAAKRLEATLPASKNSIVNWLDLRRQNLPSVVRGAVTQRAATDLTVADLHRALDNRRLLLLGGGVAVVTLAQLVAMFVIHPAHYFSLLGRGFFPFFGNRMAAQTSLTLVRPAGGNVIVSVNQPVDVAVRVTGRLPSPAAADALTFQFRYKQDEPFQQRPLQSTDPDTREWGVRVPGFEVHNGFWYKISGGDAETPEYQVQVRSTPLLTGVDVVARYRPYLHWADRTTAEPNLEELVGTEITLTAHTNRDVKTGLVSGLGRSPVRAEPVQGDPHAFRVKFTLTDDFNKTTYRLGFVSTQGEESGLSLPYTVKVLSDLDPQVILKPLDRDRVPANGMLFVVGSAADDFGLTRLVLRQKLVSPAGAEHPLADRPFRDGKPLALVDGTFPRALEFQDNLSLSELNGQDGVHAQVEAGSKLHLWLEATDNFDFPAPHVAKSNVLILTLDPPTLDKDVQAAAKKAAAERQQEFEKRQAEKQAQQNQQIEKRQEEQARREEQARQDELERKAKALDEARKELDGDKEKQGQPAPDQPPADEKPSADEKPRGDDPAKDNPAKGPKEKDPAGDSPAGTDPAGKNPGDDPAGRDAAKKDQTKGQPENDEPEGKPKPGPQQDQAAPPPGTEKPDNRADNQQPRGKDDQGSPDEKNRPDEKNPAGPKEPPGTPKPAPTPAQDPRPQPAGPQGKPDQGRNGTNPARDKAQGNDSKNEQPGSSGTKSDGNPSTSKPGDASGASTPSGEKPSPDGNAPADQNTDRQKGGNKGGPQKSGDPTGQNNQNGQNEQKPAGGQNPGEDAAGQGKGSGNPTTPPGSDKGRGPNPSGKDDKGSNQNGHPADKPGPGTAPKVEPGNGTANSQKPEPGAPNAGAPNAGAPGDQGEKPDGTSSPEGQNPQGGGTTPNQGESPERAKKNSGGDKSGGDKPAGQRQGQGNQGAAKPGAGAAGAGKPGNQAGAAPGQLGSGAGNQGPQGNSSPEGAKKGGTEPGNGTSRKPKGNPGEPGGPKPGTTEPGSGPFSGPKGAEEADPAGTTPGQKPGEQGNGPQAAPQPGDGQGGQAMDGKPVPSPDGKITGKSVRTGRGIPGATNPDRDASPQRPEEIPAGTAPNEASNHRAGDLQLEDLKKLSPDALKKMLKRANMTEEEYRQFAKDYEAYLKRLKKPDGFETATAPRRGADRLRSDVLRQLNDGKTSGGNVSRGGTAVPPPEFREAQNDFTRKLSEAGK